MDNPADFTLEGLTNLKYKELYKLSAKFNVSKKWAKKQELIDKLLSLRDQLNAKEEWQDGSTAFDKIEEPQNEKTEVDRRLTFNIDKNTEVFDRRATFDIPQIDDSVKDSRLTFEVAKTGDELTDSRATFDILQAVDKSLTPKDSRLTFDVPPSGRKLLDTTEYSETVKQSPKLTAASLEVDNISTRISRRLTFDVVLKDKEPESAKKPNPGVKTLTIPYSRVLRSNKKNDSPKKEIFKLSKKSINIKKTGKVTASLNPQVKVQKITHPANQSAAVKAEEKKPDSITGVSNENLNGGLRRGKSNTSKVSFLSPPPRTNHSRPSFPIRKTPAKELHLEANSGADKENLNGGLKRRKSKTEDNVTVKKPATTKVTFLSPPPRLNRPRPSLPLRKTPAKELLSGNKNSSSNQDHVSKIPRAKTTITVTKMPDFASIHKRQFEQMDSLHDYQRKKEERARKLFGTPQPGLQNKVQPSKFTQPKRTSPRQANNVFQFRSTNIPVKEVRFGKSRENLISPLKAGNVKNARKEEAKNKLRVQTDIKDKTRSHIHGVRTNKRFELQMKFRNL